MFEKLKTLLKGVGIAFKYGDTIHDVINAWTTYPGLDNPSELRRWVRPLLLDAQVLAISTKTPIDDMIVMAAQRIVENDQAWTAVHAMALLARDGGLFKDGVLIPESTAYQGHLVSLNSAAQDILPRCPVIVHAAIGLLLMLLQQRFTKS